jgi:serine/threonine-protein kinase
MSGKAKNPLLANGMTLNGKWEIIEHLAKGGKGEVYRARQLTLRREGVIKTISKEFLDSFEGDQEEIDAELERFRREVVVMAQVRHPNVLQVYDYERATISAGGDATPIEYIVMEYIPGPTLRAAMTVEGLGDDEKEAQQWIQKYFLPVLEGVESVHALGIVHRDIKPENVLLDGDVPKIMDFGLAGGPKWHSVTRSHHVIGTIPYMAGEQFLDMAGTDFRADVYSLGKILWEAISGKMTRDNADPFKTAGLKRPATPFLKRVDDVIRRATAEDRAQRIGSVTAFKEELLKALEEAGALEGAQERAQKRAVLRKIRFAAAAVLALAAVSAGFHVLYHRGQEGSSSIRTGSRLSPAPR